MIWFVADRIIEPRLGEWQPATDADKESYQDSNAPLTDAQLKGLRHAGILSNCEETEKTVVDCGKMTGDLTHPLPYCPEFFLPEFKVYFSIAFRY